MYTYEQKYNYLLSKLYISDADLWEKDALLQMSSVFYQFNVHPAERTFDEIIEAEMNKKVAK
jgi:hypothetical protein